MTRDNKKKLRRWGFIISTSQGGFHVPVVVYGNQTKANSIANRLKEDYSNSVESLKNKDFKVETIPHETISHTTQQQLDGMEFELKLTAKAMEMLYDETNHTKELDEKSKREAIGRYIVKAKAEVMKEYYPDGAGSAIEESLKREETAYDETDEKITLGYDAVQEALNG